MIASKLEELIYTGVKSEKFPPRIMDYGESMKVLQIFSGLKPYSAFRVGTFPPPLDSKKCRDVESLVPGVDVLKAMGHFPVAEGLVRNLTVLGSGLRIFQCGV